MLGQGPPHLESSSGDVGMAPRAQPDRAALISMDDSAVPRLAELGLDLSRGYGHHDGLNSTDLFIAETRFPGYAKVIIHSGIAGQGHGAGQVDHQRCLRFEDLVAAGGAIETIEGFFLLFGQHGRFLLDTTNVRTVAVLY